MSKYDALIELENVTFSYAGGPLVLNAIDFTLNSRERIGIIGPNGSGKTTFFHIIMGLIRPRSGRIQCFGKPLLRDEDFVEVRRKIGFLFQNSDDQLFCPTVLEDVAFGPLNLGRSPEEAREIVKETLSSLGIAGFEERISHKLSHGEKKLVALASILAMEPEVLILDEPTSGLDQATRERLVSILDDLNLSYIITSHEMDFLTRMTDTFYELSNGRIAHAKKVIPHTHTHVHIGGQFAHDHEDPFG